MSDFFSTYFDYVGVTTSEPPVVFHRWAAISMIGALLGRQCYLPFGHSKIYPNQYIMIMGSPGTRKSSAINIATGLLKDSGYDRFSSDRTSKERFLMDMRTNDGIESEDDLLGMTLDAPAEAYVAIGEFTDFIGQNNMEFVTMLTNLWDNPAVYKNPKIHGKSVEVRKPTVNILGGNTSQGFSLAFPPEALGNGFLSRLLFIYGETTGRKVTFPEAPDEEVQTELIQTIKEIKEVCTGAFKLSKKARLILDKIYKSEVHVDDHRFKHYSTRRFTHLLKICMIIAAMRLSTQVSEEDAVKANTILANAERKMPKALGEFGKGKHSDTSNKIIDILNESNEPVNSNELYRKVSQDLNKMTELHDILRSLLDAEKIQTISIHGKTGYLAKHKETQQWQKGLIQEGYLTDDEEK